MAITHTVTVTRNMRNELEAENELPIPGKPGYVLSIRTSKTRGGIGSYMQALKVEPAMDGRGFEGRSFIMFSDFHKRLPTMPGRATEQSIARVHAAALANADKLVAEAEAFYAAKDPAPEQIEQRERLHPHQGDEPRSEGTRQRLDQGR
jgi:hypothetical protein